MKDLKGTKTEKKPIQQQKGRPWKAQSIRWHVKVKRKGVQRQRQRQTQEIMKIIFK